MSEPLPPCPHCGSQPEVGKCEPWPKTAKRQPWYALCYKGGDREHFLGVNGNSREDAEAKWREEVRKWATLRS